MGMTEFLQNYVSFSKPLNRDEQKSEDWFRDGGCTLAGAQFKKQLLSAYLN
jgi:hypothetical protein